MESFIYGVITGASLIVGIKIFSTVYEVNEGLKLILGKSDVITTTKTLLSSLLLYLEQNFKQTLKFDAAKKLYSVSFFYKGRINKIWLAPIKGPKSKDKPNFSFVAVE